MTTLFIAPTQKRGQDTLQRILVATDQLMERQPFDSISIADIASAAGISVGNFYNRFRDKQSLLYALYDHYESERTEILNKSLESDQWNDLGLKDTQQKIAALLVDFFLQRRNLIRSFVLHYRCRPELASKQTRSTLRKLSRRLALRIVEAAAREQRKVAEKDAQVAIQIMAALGRELILFREDPSKEVLFLQRDELICIISACTGGYLSVE